MCALLFPLPGAAHPSSFPHYSSTFPLLPLLHPGLPGPAHPALLPGQHRLLPRMAHHGAGAGGPDASRPRQGGRRHHLALPAQQWILGGLCLRWKGSARWSLSRAHAAAPYKNKHITTHHTSKLNDDDRPTHTNKDAPNQTPLLIEKGEGKRARERERKKRPIESTRLLSIFVSG